jgi:hypothetical protein
VAQSSSLRWRRPRRIRRELSLLRWRRSSAHWRRPWRRSDMAEMEEGGQPHGRGRDAGQRPLGCHRKMRRRNGVQSWCCRNGSLLVLERYDCWAIGLMSRPMNRSIWKIGRLSIVFPFFFLPIGFASPYDVIFQSWVFPTYYSYILK